MEWIFTSRAQPETIDGRPRFTLMASDRGAFVLTFLREQGAVECHGELPDRYVWTCRYRIDADGAWTGPFAAGAEQRRMTDPAVIARDIDGWLTAVIPHH